MARQEKEQATNNLPVTKLENHAKVLPTLSPCTKDCGSKYCEQFGCMLDKPKR